MIRIASQQTLVPATACPTPLWHAGFLAMLPTIEKCACFAFRHLRGDSRDDAVEEAIANALVAYIRLVKLKKTDVAHPTVLAKYAIARVCNGKRVGGHLNVRDVLSTYAQRVKGFVVERLNCFDNREGEWIEAVVEDHRTPVADQAAFRIDFPVWLAMHSCRDRWIAETLAIGHAPVQLARQLHLSRARISQKRRELYESWQAFHGESKVQTHNSENHRIYKGDKDHERPSFCQSDEPVPLVQPEVQVPIPG